jgi:glutathione reductase (NADPH)
MRFETGAALVAIERRGTDLVARFERGDEDFEITADLVVHGAGRVPEIDRLDLDAAGIAHGPKGVTVTEHLRSTTNAHVFAAGDVADTVGPPLTPVAVHEGKVAASNMIRGDRMVPNYRGVPSAAFTLPEIVRIGTSEDEAREGDRRVRVAANDTSDWYSNRRVGASLGMTKVIVDEATDEVLGVHLLGHHYAEAANLFGLAMRSGLKARDLKRMIATYPTVGSDVGSMFG